MISFDYATAVAQRRRSSRTMEDNIMYYVAFALAFLEEMLLIVR